MSNPNFEQKDSLNLLLQSAENLIAHKELDAAETLLRVIIKRDPHHASARAMLSSIKSPPIPQIHEPAPVEKYYVDYDYHTGMYEVLDENDNRIKMFVSREEAEKFAYGER